MGQLLRAQSHRCGAPVSGLLTNTQEKAADGGADAFSGKPATPDEWLGDAKTCWQLKAGDAGEPAKVKNEILKPLPHDTLTKGGRFVLVASGSTSGKQGELLRLNTLTTEAKQAGLPTDRIVVIGSERLTEWVNQHPAIAARWANRPEGLWSLQDWPAQEHQASWQASDPLTSAIATYRQALDPTTVRPDETCLHLHLHGPPGAGKTRLALELCWKASWADFAVYVRRARASNVLELLTQAASEEGVRFVVVADDTPAELLKPLRDALEPSEGRIRLITLGTNHSPDPRRIQEEQLPPLSTDSLRELLGCWYPAMAAELVPLAVNLAAGNPRLARLAADALNQNPALTTATLHEQPAIRDLRSAIANHSPVTKKVSEVQAPALSEHDGCWRLLISVSEAKQVEGGNHPAEQRFIVDPKLVNPEASSQRPLQEFWEDQLPSGQPVSFQELRDILASLISVARRSIIKGFPGGTKPELLTILSLQYKLIREARWIHLLKKLKQTKNARPPIAIACLCRQSDGNPSGNFRWVEPGTRSIEHSLDIINLMNTEGSRFLDLRWLLIEDHNPCEGKANTEVTTAVGNTSAISRKHSKDLDLITRSQNEDCFFEDYHALFLRWKGSGSRFAKRVENIIEAGIPLFLLEPLAADPTSITSSTYLFNWECRDFVPNYCRRHRRPACAEDRSLVHSYLFWEDHRYRPLKEVPPMPTESLIPFMQ
jgi:hypothetical protein